MEEKLSHITKPINLSIIGCVVNGPGEAAQTEIGLTGGGNDNNLLYVSGIPHSKVASTEIINKVVQLVEEKIRETNKNDTAAKVQKIITKYDILEKELSSGKVEPKQFAKSKEYSNLGNIISIAKSYINFDNEKRDLEPILLDKNNDTEMIEMAKKDLNDIEVKKENYKVG